MASEVSRQFSSSSFGLSPPDIIDIPEPDDALNSDLHISPDNLDVGVKEPLQHPSNTMDVKDMPIVSPLHDVVSTSTFAEPDNSPKTECYGVCAQCRVSVCSRRAGVVPGKKRVPGRCSSPKVIKLSFGTFVETHL